MAARSTWHLRAARRDPPRARAGTRGGARNLRLPAEPPETAEHRTYARDPVPHIREWCEHLPQIPHPSVASAAHIVHDADYVIEKSIVNLGGGGGESDAGIRANDDNCADPGVDGNNTSSVTCYPRAGPRATIAFDSMRGEVCAAVVSCGGLCPGMNTVVREIVTCLWMRYGVREIWGIRNGFRGFYSSNYVPMTAESVQNLHRKGGTVLGTSRGGFDVGMVVDAIQHRRINMVFVIGGDGTHKGAQAMVDEVKRRRLKVAIACVPKTIDNDIAAIDKSFGFDTAVEEAQRAIRAAHVEAASAPAGVGLVKLMGRHSGFIALVSSLASGDVDATLIPEVPFVLEGQHGLLAFVEQRLMEHDMCVLVVAEGAGQDLVASAAHSSSKADVDASGNVVFRDVGLWLKETLKSELKSRGWDVNMKYLDPTYMIRAVPPNASDSVYCTLLAHGAVHGAMYGFTGFTSGRVNDRHCYISIPRAVKHINLVDPQARMYARLIEANNQPAAWGEAVGGANEANAAAVWPMESAPHVAMPSTSHHASLAVSGRRVPSDWRAETKKGGRSGFPPPVTVTHKDERNADGAQNADEFSEFVSSAAAAAAKGDAETVSRAQQREKSGGGGGAGASEANGGATGSSNNNNTDDGNNSNDNAK